MSSRNRARGSSSQDTDEERRLWREIRDKSRHVDTMVARSNEIGTEIIQVEAQQALHLESNTYSSAALDERLEALYRENVKLCEDVAQLIEGKSNDMNLLDSLKILAGLREASEESAAQLQAAAPGRGAGGKLSRPKKGGAAATKAAAAAAARETTVASAEDPEEFTAAPSPRVTIPNQASRLGSKDKTSRAGSIPATREASVKLEDGAESVASSADGVASSSTAVFSSKTSAAGNRPSNRLVLIQGQIVFCRHDAKNFDAKKEPPEGEGILCRVTNVIGEGKQRRYEVQDADTSGEAPPSQRANVSHLIPIPDSNRGLVDLPKGRGVLAQYPDTTTFYKAEVSESWRAKDLGSEKGEWVRLNFQDDEQTREVERRFVLNEK